MRVVGVTSFGGPEKLQILDVPEPHPGPGEVRIRVLNLDLSRRPVLQFVQSDAVKYAYPFGSRRDIRKLLFEPGDYELRILYDSNGNGVWDTGKFFGKKIQPEKVIPLRKKYTVKANWDNDVDYTL